MALHAIRPPWSYLWILVYGGSALVIACVHLRRAVPGTWALRRCMTGSMLLASISRLIMVVLLGVVQPLGDCDRSHQTMVACHALAVVVPAIAFSAAWSSSLLVLLFLTELRLAYTNVLPGSRKKRLRIAVACVIVVGCSCSLVVRMVPWPRMSVEHEVLDNATAVGGAGGVGYLGGESDTGYAGVMLRSDSSEGFNAVLTLSEFVLVLALFLAPPNFLLSLVRQVRATPPCGCICHDLLCLMRRVWTPPPEHLPSSADHSSREGSAATSH